ncbi:response regulator, partial [Arthrospira platensis SPKY1]|nr:response regulator [Arthrospira platensis SPKY1]
MVVDDNPINRLLPVAWLTRAGHEVVECAGGEEVFELLKAGDVELLLLDISMPGLSGSEICTRLRATPEARRLRIVAYTAHALPEMLEAYLAEGFDDVIVKPVTREVLMA